MNGILLLTENDKLRQQIRFTSTETGFSEYLLEKDFYLTVLLYKISQLDLPLVFKGGTCLNKCHIGYYRLSEDLDFVIDQKAALPRTKRRDLFRMIVSEIEKMVQSIPQTIIVTAQKYDEHHQLQIVMDRKSIFTDKSSIKIEISCRFPLVLPTEIREVQHLFQHPFTNAALLPNIQIRCMSLEECMAEKIRASITRMTPAIRDFFDIWYMKTVKDFNFLSEQMQDLIALKLSQSDSIRNPKDSIIDLRRQISTELIPTLGGKTDFDLEDTINFVCDKYCEDGAT